MGDFSSTMDYLRNNMLLPPEFALRVSRMAGEQCRLPDDFTEFRGSAEKYAFSLGKKELEDCLVCLLQENRPEVRSRILLLLQARMSTRLASLIWALVQYYYESPEMKKAAMLAAASEHCSEELLMALFFREQDFIDSAVNIIRVNGGVIARVISRYNIIVGSPLCNTVIRSFFQQGDEKNFLMNEDFFLDIIDQSSEEEILPVLINYLDQPWEYYSSRKINRKLLERFGLPEDGDSSVWSHIDSELIKKYQQWIFIDIMEGFFGVESRKNLVFSRNYRDIKHIRFYSNDEIMVLDFGQFGIVNIRGTSDYSWLMEKKAMEMEMESLHEGVEPRWTVRRMDIEARDVIIEEMSADILVLNVAGIGRLYVEEMLTELLRKGEEIWPVRFKHAIARFRTNTLSQV